MHARTAAIATLWILSLGACDGPSGRERFAAEVAPVLVRRCGSSACHATDAEGRSSRRLRFRVDADGVIADDAMDDAYASARSFIDTTELPDLSSLLRKAVPASLGGVAHAGGAAFHDRADPAYQSMRAWIASERGGGEDGDPRTLTEGERYFEREVQPGLALRQCMFAPCHGEASAVPLRFDAGVLGAFGVAATRRNYREALVHLSLGGHPERSRLALKPLRDLASALPHRGGNGINAFPTTLADALPRAVIEWARLERRLRTGEGDGGLTGVAFVGGPIGPARVTEHDGFTPGSDVYLLAPPTREGSVRNLTGGAHSAPADLRDPAVNDMATALAFSMRESADAPARLWELDLRTGVSHPLTEGVRLPDGRWSTDRWPAYGPDGRLWFVSNRAGMLSEHGDGYDTDLYVLEGDGTLTRRSFTPSPELATTFFRYGHETSGSVAFTAIRRLGDGYKGVVYRFPNDLHSEYHQHVGITLGDDLTWRLRETPEGDYVGLLLDRDAVWSAGALMHVDRNLGIELPLASTVDSSLTGYRHPVTYLGPYGSPSEALLDPYAPGCTPNPVRRLESDGAWRDPHPLPDGRIVASWADGVVRLQDRSAPPDFGLYAITLERDRSTGALHIAHRDRLVDLPGVSETQPVPVFRNVPGLSVEAAPQGDRGSLVYNGAPMIEAILRQVGPAGPRRARDDIRSVRILGWVPRALDPPLPPRPGLPGELRRSGAGPHLPARILAEIPLESDGTLFASLPARTAFRLQYLDARGMAVGTQHNRWIDIHGGQELRLGASSATFDSRCSPCHGARSGRGPDALAPVDVTSRASRSLARFDRDDPDRPRPPYSVDGSIEAPWRSVVAPALARSCATLGCHDAAARAAGLVLQPVRTDRYDQAYESLVSQGASSLHGYRYVDVTGTSARGSHLIERILGEELDAPAAIPGTGAHRGDPPLDDASLRALVRWIESGATFCADDCL